MNRDEVVARIPRGFPLSAETVWAVTRAAAHYGAGRVRVGDLAIAFEGAWPHVSSVSPTERAYDRFATRLHDLLRGLERAGFITLTTTNPRRSLSKLNVLRVPPREADLALNPIEAFLDAVEREILMEVTEERDFAWTPARLADATVELAKEGRTTSSALSAPPANALATVGVGEISRLVESELGQHRQRRGVAVHTLLERLGADASLRPDVERVLDQAVEEGELSAFVDRGVQRWRSQWAEDRRGVARVLRILGWARHGHGKPPALTRTEIADAAKVGVNAITGPVRALVDARLIVEDDERRLSAGGARREVLEWLAPHLRAGPMTVREVIRHLRGEHLLKRKGASGFDDEAAWAMVDDLVPTWLEGGRYAANRRPRARVPLKQPLWFAPEAWHELERCAACGDAWGNEDLKAREVTTGFGSTWSLVVHERCAFVRCACATCDHRHCGHPPCPPSCDHVTCAYVRPTTSCPAAACDHSRCRHPQCAYAKCAGRCEETQCAHQRCGHPVCAHSKCRADCPTAHCSHGACNHTRCAHTICNHMGCEHSFLSPARHVRIVSGYCPGCKEPFEPIDTGPIRVADLDPPELGAYVEGWMQVRVTLLRMADDAEEPDGHPQLRQRIAALRAAIAQLEDMDLRPVLAPPRHEETDFMRSTRALGRYLPNQVLGSLEYKAERGKAFTFHFNRLADAVRNAEARRYGGTRLRWNGNDFVHPKCATSVTPEGGLSP